MATLKTTLLLILFFFICHVGYSQNGLGGVYRYERTYNADGDVIKSHAINKIMVSTACYWGCTASYSFYNDIIAMWDPGVILFQYRDYNNGWYIFNFDGGMFTGNNYLYIHEDNSRVRVKFSTDRGNYHQYKIYNAKDDIDKGPTR